MTMIWFGQNSVFFLRILGVQSQHTALFRAYPSIKKRVNGPAKSIFFSWCVRGQGQLGSMAADRPVRMRRGRPWPQ
jgi:hypothetical protein